MTSAPKNRRQNLPVRGGDRKPARVRPYSLTGGRTRFAAGVFRQFFMGSRFRHRTFGFRGGWNRVWRGRHREFVRGHG